MHRRDFDPSSAPVYELVQEVLRLRADIAIMAASVVQQAVEREWCGEYDQWARITNKMLSRPHLIERTDLQDDPSLDESGRWSVNLVRPNGDTVNSGPPDGQYRDPSTGQVWCPACNRYHAS